jgi:hypothetical protein
VEAFVDKQRRLDNNLQEAKVPAKVDVGAVWTEPPEQGAGPAKITTATVTAAEKDPNAALHGGHFMLPAAAEQH